MNINEDPQDPANEPPISTIRGPMDPQVSDPRFITGHSSITVHVLSRCGL